MSKPGKSLKVLCKRLGVRLTVKRGKKRVYKSVAVLKRQCANKKKKKKVKRKRNIKRRRKFGTEITENIWKNLDPERARATEWDGDTIATDRPSEEFARAGTPSTYIRPSDRAIFPPATAGREDSTIGWKNPQGKNYKVKKKEKKINPIEKLIADLEKLDYPTEKLIADLEKARLYYA